MLAVFGMRLLVLAACLVPVFAQDTRKVVEPAIPPACFVVKAKLGRAGTSLVPEDETKLDTVRIQAALNACPAGESVVLQPAGYRTDAFLTGPLDLRKGVTLVVDRGAYLFGSRNPRDYDVKPGVCGTITDNGAARGCRALINGDGVADAGVMGDGVIDGRGGETMLGQSITWWNLADKARAGGSQQNPRLVVLNRCDNFTLYRITLVNSPQFHVVYSGNGFTAWGVRIFTPQRARNTDGIDPGNCRNVTITHCFIWTGDNQIAIKAGGHVSQVTIAHNHLYVGGGFAIGSETYGGAEAIRVTDLSIDQSDNGIHLKSNNTRGGLVRDVVFEDVCIRDARNPIWVETGYTAYPATANERHDRLPEFREIAFRNVRVGGGGKVTLEGLDAAHPIGIQLDNVVFDDPAQIRAGAKHAQIQVAPPLSVRIGGDDVQVSTAPGASRPNACVGKFAPFPMP
jgi:polygalacturonase